MRTDENLINDLTLSRNTFYICSLPVFLSLVFVEWIRKYENVLDNHGEGSGGGGGGTL